MVRMQFVVLAVALIAVPAYAHKLTVRTHIDGDAVAGEVRAIPGGPAANARVQLRTTDGREMDSSTTGPDGTFRLQVTERVDHVVVAETADGHRATAAVSAEDLPPSVGSGPSEAREPQSGDPAEPAGMAAEHGSASKASFDAGPLVAEIRQLREEIHSLESALRFRDILGGIGFILGVMGAIALWKARPHKDDSQ